AKAEPEPPPPSSFGALFERDELKPRRAPLPAAGVPSAAPAKQGGARGPAAHGPQAAETGVSSSANVTGAPSGPGSGALSGLDEAGSTVGSKPSLEELMEQA